MKTATITLRLGSDMPELIINIDTHTSPPDLLNYLLIAERIESVVVRVDEYSKMVNLRNREFKVGA